MLRSPCFRAATIAIFVTCAARFAMAFPAANECVEDKCSDALVIFTCGQDCDRYSLPHCSRCFSGGICRYRSAGPPNNCVPDSLVPNITIYNSNTCDEDCLCANRGDPMLIFWVEAKNFSDGDEGNVILRKTCTNARVQPVTE